jgi:hypothetical protein
MSLPRVLVALAGGVLVAAEAMPAGAQAGVRGGPRVQIVAPAAARGEVGVKVGTPFRLHAQLSAGGATRSIDDQVTWTSSDTSVLVISDGRDGRPAGQATPLRAGVVGVTATYPRLESSMGSALAAPVGDSIVVVIAEASPGAAATTLVEADPVAPRVDAE